MRTVTIGGVRVRPKWNWSLGYRRLVASESTVEVTHPAPRSPEPGWKRRANMAEVERKARAYLEWWLEGRGRDIPQPAACGEVIRVFGEWTEYEHGPRLPSKLRALRYESGRWSGGAYWNGAPVATIEIPHWDFGPSMLESPDV